MRTAIQPSTLLRIAAAIVVASLILPATPDVDMWGHTMFGGDIVRSGAVPRVDHYSFTSDLPWVNHEWLSEVAMYCAYALGGGAGLVTLRIVVVAAFLAVAWTRLRRDGVPREPAFAMVTILALLTYPRTQHVRPQLFSLVAFATMLCALQAYERRRTLAWLMAVPLVLMAWANLHGGFIVALLPIGLWTLAVLADMRMSAGRRVGCAAILASAAPATLLNPYGAELWRFLWRTVGLGRSDIGEWWSIASAGPGVLSIWLMTALIALAGIKWHPRPLPLHRVGLVMLLALASFRVSRLDAFFAIATIMCFGPSLATFWTREREVIARPPRRFAQIAAVAVAILPIGAGGMTLLRAAPSNDGCVDRAWWLPDQESTAFIAQNELEGTMLVYFDWGEYTLWQFGTRLKISTDGRRETVYSDRHIDGHLQFYAASDRGMAYFRELNPDYVWLPAAFSGFERLKHAGWAPIHVSERSQILARADLAATRAYRAPAMACFPGDVGKPSPLSTGLWKQ